MKRSVLWATVFVAGLVSGVARADCVDADLVAANDVVVTGDFGGYDGFDPVENIEEAMMRVRLIEGEACALAVTIKSIGNESGQRRMISEKGASLDYFILRSRSGREILVNSAEPNNDSILRSFAAVAGDEETITFFVAIPEGQIVDNGMYQDQINIRLYAEDAGQYRQLVEIPAIIQTSVPEKADISISVTDRDFDISLTTANLSFDDLETGETGEAFIRVRSNADYEVMARSENEGVLAHEVLGAEATIAYTMTLAGRSAPLDAEGGAAPLLNEEGPTPASGDAHRIEITIGETAGRPAGSYADTIVFTVTPQI